MFDFLRNLRDEVVADLSICVHGLKHSPEEVTISATDKEFDENGEYLSAIGVKNAYTCADIMTEIKNKNLSGAPIDKISSTIYCSTEDIIDTLESYGIMNFLKSKSYSAGEAKEIMRVANIFDKDRSKTPIELSELANCSEDSASAVIKLLQEFGDGQKFRPFTIGNATPNSGQKPVVQPPKTTSSKTNKKTTAAS